MEKFTIPSRCLDVAASADLVVVGGGSAGVAAAIAAARRGCSPRARPRSWACA